MSAKSFSAGSRGQRKCKAGALARRAAIADLRIAGLRIEEGAESWRRRGNQTMAGRGLFCFFVASRMSQPNGIDEGR